MRFAFCRALKSKAIVERLRIVRKVFWLGNYPEGFDCREHDRCTIGDVTLSVGVTE